MNSDPSKKVEAINSAIQKLIIAQKEENSARYALILAESTRRAADRDLVNAVEWSVDALEILHFEGGAPYLVEIKGEPEGTGGDCSLTRLSTPGELVGELETESDRQAERLESND